MKIENLNECKEMDVAAREAVAGGYSWASTWFVSETTNIFQQNPLNVNIGAGDGGVVAMGNFSPMLLSAGSAMTWAQGFAA